MSEDIRKLAIQWMEENSNHRREEVIDELMHPECVGRLEGGEINSRDEWRQARKELESALMASLAA
jgi:hypothetical protein